ncbi:DNA translocase FtsK [Agrobacterium rosae]|uniref:Cell division protein FtsK n=1 Tax=Agrobacterium rosae TaxID=1972867 RepID=A0AAE5RVQ6_9HYPH|nr:DNA translocase FtsK [Agrobacterium rosae]KAA3515523.1 DNA translocase FtsK [Agrobacterium rosae]KAA3524488.1 DNA translocase FtsK [Agrobacterium rosae]MBN7804203.1 DNA translocase FtsK [Agrobacterium rosae]MCM2431404.1 DNA translocase FtsK [Agrobacterium rosae]MQB46854.1 DNA translocase FtsK [Agrobacterium rosae]
MMSVQAVMRFPRSNSNYSLNMIDERGQEQSIAEPSASQDIRPELMPLTADQRAVIGHNADQNAANAIEGREEMPLWQNHFTLGPNVRFTRTPQNLVAGKQAPTSAQSRAETEIVPVAAAPEPAVVAAVEKIAPKQEPVERRIAKPAVLPQPPGATGALALTYRLRRELALRQEQEASTPIEAAADVTQVSDAVSAEQIDVACFPTEQPAASFDVPAFAEVLSDEMFWEAMSLDVGTTILPPSQPMRLAELARIKAQRVAAAPMAAAVVKPAPRPAQVIRQTLPTIEKPAFIKPEGSAVALYRQVDVRPVQQSDIQEVEQLQVSAAVEEPMPVPAVVEEAVVEAVALTAPRREMRTVARNANQPMFLDAPVFGEGEYEFPPIDLLQKPQVLQTTTMTPEALEQSAGLLESVLEDFGIKGEIIDVRPGPVVTLYEFEPAPGVKSSRVIGLSDDIARSMSALSARVAVVPGRNVIGIELPNPVRETVYFRELIESPDYSETRMKLALCLGKTIGGEPVVAELAKMPHLLVAGTTGSGKSVAINTMILSLLYRLKPEECRLIMVDPKMLELSVYDGIPHLLTPVVTDPKKAVMALKWAVREMEDRYRKMSRLGVRNIDGYNARAASARAKGETVMCNVQTGFDRATGEAVYEQEEMDLTAMPYIVVIVDEMADLMMVAGKEIEGAIQRLAQMARAAGIHLIMATQRPSVDVITGTIKANFPTRISFQVTSKIDSRTILGEQGAEHLLGQGDMLHMVGGGRISRVHGPFVSDEEVEKVVAHLKTQGRPEYLGTVTEDADEADEGVEEDSAVFDKSAMGEDDTADLYEKAVKVVLRDKKCSTSYIQRRLSIGYNRAASLVERMEQEGIVGPANHVGKRSIIVGEREMCEVPGAID